MFFSIVTSKIRTITIAHRHHQGLTNAKMQIFYTCCVMTHYFLETKQLDFFRVASNLKTNSIYSKIN